MCSFWKCSHLDSIILFPMTKLVQMSNFNFLFLFLEKWFSFYPFWVPGDCDVTGRVKFRIFSHLDWIIAFPMSKLVQMPNFNFLFNLVEKLYTFDPFWVPCTCDVTDGVKNCIFSNMDSIIAFSMSKLLQMPNSNFYSISLRSGFLLTLFGSLGIVKSQVVLLRSYEGGRVLS